MEEVERMKESGTLVDFFAQIFEQKFGVKPSIDDDAIKAIHKLKANYNLQTCRGILESYLNLDDEFLKRNGYKLRYLDNYVNAAIVNMPKVAEPKPLQNLRVMSIFETRQAYGESLEDIRRDLKCNPDGSDDWLHMPGNIPDEQYQAWKKKKRESQRIE